MPTLGNTWTQIGSASVTINGATLTYIVEAQLSSQSVAENKSYINTRARTTLSSGASMSAYNYSFSCTGCATRSGTGLWTYTSETVLTGSTSVTHNDDGTGTLTVAGSCSGSIIGTLSASGSISLPTIARASKPSVSKQSLVLDGSDSLTISTNRKSSSFTHTIRITIGSNTATFNNITDSYVFKPTPSIWMPYMTSYEMQATITCTTYNGSTQIGSSQTCTFTVRVDTSTEYCELRSYTLTDTNQATAAVEPAGTFIKNASDLQATLNLRALGDYTELASVTVQNGLSSQTVALSGTSQTVTVTFSGVSAVTLAVTVTDTRGYSTRQTITFSLINYSAVAITTASAERCNANGTPSDTGSYLSYKVDIIWYEGSFGNTANTVNLTYKYRQRGSSGNYTTGTLSASYTAQTTNGVTAYQFTGVTGAEFPAEQQFDLIFTVADMFTSADSAELVIHEGIPVYGWGRDHFDVYGDLYIHDRSNAMNYFTISGVNPPIIFRTFSRAYSSLAAGSNLTITAAQLNLSTPAGYTPIGLQKVTTGYNNVGFRFFDPTATGSSTALVLFNSGSSAASSTASVTVAYVYTALIQS